MPALKIPRECDARRDAVYVDIDMGLQGVLLVGAALHQKVANVRFGELVRLKGLQVHAKVVDQVRVNFQFEVSMSRIFAILF